MDLVSTADWQALAGRECWVDRKILLSTDFRHMFGQLTVELSILIDNWNILMTHLSKESKI